MTISQTEFLKDARPLAERLIEHAMEAGKPYGITNARVGISMGDSLKAGVEKGAVVQNISGASFGVSIALYAGDRILSFS